MRAIILMFDSLNRHMLPPYADTVVDAPNFTRLAAKAVTFDNFYAGSLPCMPARRELHTGRYNFLHRSWGPLEPFDDSMPELLKRAAVHTHLVSDHPHYWEDGGATYHTRYTTWEFFRGQEGDPWKGVVAPEPVTGSPFAAMRRQDQVNRSYMPTEAEHSQTRTVDAGIHFLETNAHADRWLLQIELFDPHEPFFVHDVFKKRYQHEYEGPEFDWPAYQKVTEPADQVEHARLEYAALVSMCDHSLGRVLDFMDSHGMWDDTLLIVNTDHGFLLGEHGWWAKGVQPWFNELVHLPFFLWDPRQPAPGQRHDELTQTMDIAPTVLGFFGIQPPADMQGRDLAAAPPGRDAALFGAHGGHVNVTDGRHVYMRAAADESNAPLDEFTLMPTHMRARFTVDELSGWEPAAPFTFTKGLRTMRTVGTAARANPSRHGTLLFDLVADPGQNRPLIDDDLEKAMIGLLVAALREADAPSSQYERLGLPLTGAVGDEHLLVRRQRARAERMWQPVPDLKSLPHPELLRMPVDGLLADPVIAAALDAGLPWLTRTEHVAIPPGTSLLQLAATGDIAAAELERVANRFSEILGAELAEGR